jgi:hypothetical protein
MKNAFERTIRELQGKEKQFQGVHYFEIVDMVMLNQFIQNIDMESLSEEDRKMTLNSIRMVTTGDENSKLYLSLKSNNLIIIKILSLLLNPQVSMYCKSEALWILANLICFTEVAKNMVENFNIYSIIAELF